MKNKITTPNKAKSHKQICGLGRDNVSTRNSWLLLNGDGKLTITNQRSGHESTGSVIITYKEFERFYKFYQTGK